MHDSLAAVHRGGPGAAHVSRLADGLFGLTRYNCLDYELKISLSHRISLVCFAKKSFDRRRYFLQYGLAYKMYFASWKNKANPPNRVSKHVTK